MAKFDLLTPPYLADAIASPALSFFTKKHGKEKLKIEQPFSTKVNWSPTFQLQSAAAELTIVEVAESLYPAIFQMSYASLINDEAVRAIKVYQACPLTSLQNDKKHEARKLKTHGFGLVTVDENGDVEIQFPAAVLIHHISDTRFHEIVKGLPSDVKSAVSNSFDIYRTNAKQGLQHSGQVVEALIHSIARQMRDGGRLSSYSDNHQAAKVIDQLYNSQDKELVKQRASLGGARQFMKLDRNSSSHPSKSKKQAQSKVVSTKDGFEQSVRVCGELCKARKALGFKKKISL